ncbi:hypothetical protein Pan241w_40190 [Gimesia alba]|uniref:Uncharacterized protein n=2 Tax=Gimesia alba TaxID=2527973 RepID=A0A517RJ68_9PLAN|nr:hypothetical protein Pan241w_40190 [Gimesia alba]
MTGFVVVKTGLVKRKLTTVYLLLIVSCYFTAGCLRQPSEVISQSSKKSEDALIASKSSSSFNFFDSKKKTSDKETAAKVKVSGYYPNANQVDLGTEAQLSHAEIAANALINDRGASEGLNKPSRKTVEAPLENWRSKSLVESAKKYPAKVAETYHRKIDRIKQASSSVNQEITNGIQRVSNAIPAAESKAESKQAKSKSAVSAAQSELVETTPFRTEEISRSLDQIQDQKIQSQLSQMGKDLKQDLEQMQPAFDDVNQEMRRLQIDSVMARAKRELKQKNYEYAEFLAEQALESSYRGHVAFGIDEQSPQMLLQQIKSSKPAMQTSPARGSSNVQAVEHAQPKVQTNSGQKVHNFQFQPSRVHPLKRRAVTKPQSPEPPKTQSRPSAGSSEELPLIVPRNVGNEPQSITIQPRQRDVWGQKKRSGGIGLEPPSFEEKAEEPFEIPFPKKTAPPQTNSVPSPSLELEEVTDEPPARIRLSGPEPAQQESVQPKSVPVPQEPIKAVEKAESPTAPGPKLMLPKLPALPGDLTSQADQPQGQSATMLNHSGGKQGVQTAPVKFRSKIQERRENGRVLNGENRNGPLAETSLTLDEIEWDLDEKKRPQLRSAWSGMTTLLLIVGGVIILLLLMIIVILLRRGNPSP